MNPFDSIEHQIAQKVAEAEGRLSIALQVALIGKAVQAELRDLIALDPDPKRKAKWEAALTCCTS